MLNDFPRQKLRTLIQEYGPTIIEDARRCRALLLDYCSDYPREVNVLIKALEEGIPANLCALMAQTAIALAMPPALRLAQLTQQLVDMWMFEETAAQWAVETWALALNVIQSPEERCEGVEENNQKKEESDQKKLVVTLTHRITPRPNSARRPEVSRDSELRKLQVLIIAIGILISFVSARSTAKRATPSPTIDTKAISAQATAHTELLENLLSGPSTPDHSRLTLLPTDGRINCSGADLTLDLAWELSGEENLDTHYRYEVYSGVSEKNPRQRIAEGIVAAPAVSVTLPCAPSAQYYWRVSATNGTTEKTKTEYFIVRCEQRLCQVTSW